MTTSLPSPRRSPALPLAGLPVAALIGVSWLASMGGGLPAAVAAPPLAADADGEALGRAMAARTVALLAALDGEQRSLASTALDNPERRTWAFGPVRREGLRLDQISAEQFALLEGLLDCALSESGMRAWHEIRDLETVLRRLESTPERVAENRDPNLYWLRVYGAPSPDAEWSWRFEGHHVALHVACAPGSIPTVTPFFLGANPLFTNADDADKGRIRVEAFEALNAAYLAALGHLDERTAMAAAPELGGEGPKQRPGDIRMGPGQPKLPPLSGVALADLSDEARASIKGLLETYLDLLEPGLCPEDAVSLEGARFARWAGTALDEARTWSIQTKTFAMELATTDGPHHVHALLRDVTRDFGGPATSK